jgi:hypothetical protein
MKIDLEKLRKLATIKHTLEPEYDDFTKHFDDETCVAWIRDQLERGNEWAWCTIKITAAYGGLETHDYLGACSYESEASFVQNGDYYEDMVTTALKELATDLEKIGNDHEIWEHDEEICFWCIAKAFKAS